MSDIIHLSGGFYCTLYRIGHWISPDAQCVTSAPDKHPGLINHDVHFNLVGKHGEVVPIGYSIITGQEHTAEVFDEDGETFADLDAAIRHHAESLIRLTPMPGLRVSKPPRHETWQGKIVTAF
jgi:hypothetical protein